MKETNMEHFRGEIEKNEYSVAMRNGKLTKCKEIECADCKFNIPNCVRERTKWLMSEYKEDPVLTAREKHFVEFAQEGWIARDEDSDLYFYPSKPAKKKDCWGDVGTYINFKFFGDSSFHFITWEDEEAWSVEDLRKLKTFEEQAEKNAIEARNRRKPLEDIVQQLEEASELDDSPMYEPIEMVELEKAIEIVKSGGKV